MPLICQEKYSSVCGAARSKIALDLDVIIPLYLVAVKCSATSVRREAIELLLNYPRWEGLWDSLVSGNIAKWIMDVESVYEG